MRNNETIKQSENIFVPICLPHYNDNGFLHCLISYISEETICLLFSSNSEFLPHVKEIQQKIQKKFEEEKIFEEIKKNIKKIENFDPKKEFHLQNEENNNFLIHFIYKKKKISQFFAPIFLQPPYNRKNNTKRVLNLYKNCIFKNKNSLKISESKIETVFFEHVGFESVYSVFNEDFDIFIVFNSLVTHSQVVSTCEELKIWINKNEKSVFVQKYCVF